MPLNAFSYSMPSPARRVKRHVWPVLVSLARFSRAGAHVIPAKAGIQYLRRSVPKVCGVDSRLRGNDVGAGTSALFK